MLNAIRVLADEDDEKQKVETSTPTKAVETQPNYNQDNFAQSSGAAPATTATSGGSWTPTTMDTIYGKG